ncbi:hypothetical protein B0H16DRAFT_1461083 [Mycena metata]|uniref:Uncharacterized protein n=1 Tax=Mycena metata TaxID=1033252 RepID=A0AAD7ISV7_9AGAR|nr:hypothetical protein B0H16DRAFT_1461083 [Mycena metata]
MLVSVRSGKVLVFFLSALFLVTDHWQSEVFGVNFGQSLDESAEAASKASAGNVYTAAVYTRGAPANFRMSRGGKRGGRNGSGRHEVGEGTPCLFQLPANPRKIYEFFCLCGDDDHCLYCIDVPNSRRIPSSRRVILRPSKPGLAILGDHPGSSEGPACKSFETEQPFACMTPFLLGILS